MKRKILVIKMSALGDLFIALPHVEAICAHHREDEVWLMTGPSFAGLFAAHPSLQTVVLDRGRRWGTSSPWGRVAWVRRQRFHALYDLQGNRTSRRLVRFCGAPVRVGTQPKSIYTAHPAEPYRRTTPQHVFDRLNDTLSAGGVAPARAQARLYPAAADTQAVSAWKARQKIAGRPYILIHAGSSPEWPSKRWPLSHFIDLARRIEARGVRCIWIGGRDDAEINRAGARSAGIDATGAFNPLQLWLMGRDALFAMNNDSGPMHILALSGVPLFGFFGPTDWIRSHAVGQGERVLRREVACSPCFSGRCTNGKGHICLDPILPETVFDRVAPLLP